MLLAIDIGNSNVTLGLSDQDNWLHIWRLPTINESDSLMYYEVQLSNLLLEHRVNGRSISKVVISSVVPDLRELFIKLSNHLFKVSAIVIGPPIYPQLSLKVLRPDELGTDLYANALAAYHRFNKACIICDFGTALTFTVIDDKGALLGVNIAPGLKTAISALSTNTAQLPEVPLELPSSVLGQNTVHAIQSGVLIGYVGLVKHMVEAIRQETNIPMLAIATGGLSSILHPLHTFFDAVIPELTLDGLRIVGQGVDN